MKGTKMKKIILACLLIFSVINFAFAEEKKMVWSEELCEALSAAALKKSREMNLDISFAIADENGLPRMFRRFGNALVLSTILVPNKAYTSAITQTATKDLAKVTVDGGALFGINSADNRITYVAGGFPLFYQGKIVGAIGIGGGTEKQDCEIGEYVVKTFNDLITQK